MIVTWYNYLMDNSDLLEKSLRTSFIDKNYLSPEEYHARLLCNDPEQNEKIISHLLRSLQNCDEFYFSVAFITMNGLIMLLKVLRELKKRGIRGKILTTDYLNFNDPAALRKLLTLDNVEVKVFDSGDFHTKCYIFKNADMYNIIVGSSNLTAGALTTNTEWNLKISSLREGDIASSALSEFKKNWNNASELTPEWITEYEERFKKIQSIRAQRNKTIEKTSGSASILAPNKMQSAALDRLAELRIKNISKALIISATGTGKTYLSAFDARAFNAKRLLFIVHREQIAKSALESFKRVFGDSRTYGVLTGGQRDLGADFIFATIQTLSREDCYRGIDPELFDYIIVDEAHRASAQSYRIVFDYFKPKFLLGMTATPERSDGASTYELFDHNIAYEIRLQDALASDMLCPFHYFGIAELAIDGVEIDDNASFNYLTSDERVRNVIEYAKYYGYSGDRVKGLIFVSRTKEAIELSRKFNELGFRTIALVGVNNHQERQDAIRRLETDINDNNALDYIFTIDIFNEGVDIPKVNQIIMLRPTQSAVIFVQQLGRGLRKAANKDYVVVLDFIGNYNNNFMIPIALSGDKTLNKDTLRKAVIAGSPTIPGCSTISFDEVAEKRIFESLNKTNFSALKILRAEYLQLKEKIGHIPTMMDFYRLGSIDPNIIIKSSNSYYEFLQKFKENVEELSIEEIALLRYASIEFGDGKRPSELVILQSLLDYESVDFDYIRRALSAYREYSDLDIISAINVMNGSFLTDPSKKRYSSLYFCDFENGRISRSDVFHKNLSENLRHYLKDLTDYALLRYEDNYFVANSDSDLKLFEKYSRRDACRLLNWEHDDSSTVYGYRIKHNTCPIFVTLNKDENISESTNYDDKFINRSYFSWLTRSNVTLDSTEVVKLRNAENNKLKIHLFVKKANAEGTDFYYLGEAHPEHFAQQYMDSGNKKLPVVNIRLRLANCVREDVYDYLTR